MSTVGVIVDRCFRTYLEPPNARAALSRLNGAIDADDVSLVVDLNAWVVPEDELLMRKRVLLEIGSELIEVLSYDEFTGTCTVTRGAEATTPAVHADGASIKLSPQFPRQSVFDAVADNIVTLFPDLYTVRSIELSSAGGVAALDDPLAVSIVSIWAGAGGRGPSISGQIVDFHQAVGGRAVVMDAGPIGSSFLRYRRRFGSATTEADTWEDLGLDPRWVNIVVLGACADLFAGADLKEATTEWVGGVLAAESITVGTRAQLAGAMLRYREALVERAKEEMRSEYKTAVRYRPTQVVYR